MPQRSPGKKPGEVFGLTVCAENIEDDPNNTTRFLVIGAQEVAPSGKDKTSLVMSARNVLGAIHELLAPLAQHGVSMSRLESRPSRAGLWEYVFFVDIEGHQQDTKVAKRCRNCGKSGVPKSARSPSYPYGISYLRILSLFLYLCISCDPIMNLCDLAPEYIRAISPYQPGKPISELAREMGMDERSIIKLASNENPLGTSPLALEAMSKALDEVALYPDGSGFELKAALSQRYGVTSSQIVLGNGSNDVLELAARVFLKPGASAVYSQHAFAVYPLVTQAVGASGISIPAMNYGHDLDAMLDAVTPETRMVFIANPNNPTGTLLTAVRRVALSGTRIAGRAGRAG